MVYIYEDNRVYAEDDDLLLAEVTFPYENNDTVNIDHVFVDPSLRGQGIASEIMKFTYSFIKEKGLKTYAACPYAIRWFDKYPEFQDILVKR
ncbi:MAG: GNAT family N-acetyltransferase [Tenericutes bacterium]|jgi:predicted GNAT family acetyltransferase|nr:GNAT family N-acetyltransferase [Mycoplasmatota bacterium]